MTSLFFKEKKEAIFCCTRCLSLPLHVFPPVFQTFILKSRRNYKVWISCCFLCHKLKPEGCEYHEFELTSSLRSMHLKNKHWRPTLFCFTWVGQWKSKILSRHSFLLRWQHLNFLSGHGYEFITVIFLIPLLTIMITVWALIGNHEEGEEVKLMQSTNLSFFVHQNKRLYFWFLPFVCFVLRFAIKEWKKLLSSGNEWLGL